MPASALDAETTDQRVEYVCPRCEGVVAREDTVCPHCGQVLEVVAAADQERPVRIETRTAARVDYAGWWRRFGAWLVDWTILLGVPVTLLIVILASAGASEDTAYGVTLLAGITLMPLQFLYFALLNGRGQTLGKRLFRIRVVDEETGEPIGFGRGAGREGIRFACWSVFWIPFFIDGLWPLWNERHQSWHDSVASSIVVRSTRSNQRDL